MTAIHVVAQPPRRVEAIGALGALVRVASHDNGVNGLFFCDNYRSFDIIIIIGLDSHDDFGQ
jgi:hypothetical protein